MAIMLPPLLEPVHLRSWPDAYGDEGRAIDFATNANAEHRHEFIADKADDASQGDSAQKRDRLRMEEPGCRLIASHKRAEQNDEHDCNAREIFDPPVTIRERRRRLALRELECNPQRDSGRRISDVVDRVGKKRNASRCEHDDDLQAGGNGQNDK